MKLEEAVEILKEIYTSKGIDGNNETVIKIRKVAIETVLNYVEILERAVDNKYCFIVGGRTLYSRLKELEKEDLIKIPKITK